jgi:hypothetical protein
MGAEWVRRPWLWATVALLASSAPAFAVCAVPTIKGSNVQGRVYDLHASHEQPVAGATVRLLNDSGKVVAQVSAAPDGSFSISAPTRGHYRLAVTAEGFFEVSAVVVAKKAGKNTPFLRVDLGTDGARPCGGGGITAEAANSGAVGR